MIRPEWGRTEVVLSILCGSKNNACRRNECSSFQQLQVSRGSRSTFFQKCPGKFQRLVVVVGMWPSRGSSGTLKSPYIGRVYNFFTFLVPGVVKRWRYSCLQVFARGRIKKTSPFLNSSPLQSFLRNSLLHSLC